MLEIPRLLIELIKKLLIDFQYFTYAMLNGGAAGILGIIVVVIIISSLFMEEE